MSSTGMSFPQCSIVFAITGDYLKLDSLIYSFIQDCKSLREQNIELILICDGVQWSASPLLQNLASEPRIQVVYRSDSVHHFGPLFNEGLKLAQSPFVLFAWPGVMLEAHFLFSVLDQLKVNVDAAAIYTQTHRVKGFPEDEIQHGWLQYENLISLAGTFFRTDKLRQIGGFSTLPELQRYLDWDLFVRLSRYERLIKGKLPIAFARWSPLVYPFLTHQVYSRGDAQSLILGQKAMSSRISVSSSRPIRATVVGGAWEPTHSQLCFYNYFETEEGRKDFAWKTLHDLSMSPEDLANSDIVFICRGRTKKTIELLKWCQIRKIPTVYMIDDNWLTVGRDWPEYKDLFAPGKPDYDHFIESMRESTVTLVYSPLLQMHVEPYARQVKKLDVNICLDHFKFDKAPRQRPLVGYVGSMRKNKEAFDALSQFLNRNPSWDLLFYGNGIPESIQKVADGVRVKLLPYENYHRYAQTLARVRPDILIAPLDDTEFSKSKCPNKFLEISAVGAVGVYSDISPYSGLVKHRENGLLVSKEDTQNSSVWLSRLEELARDPELRSNLFQNASQLIAKRFNTPQRYSEFRKMVDEVIALNHRGDA
jgi:glycosyltransferase involved in cell wall biosynthesis